MTPPREAPSLPTVDRAADDLDRLGATAVRDVLRLTVALGEQWTRQPPAVLRSGGLGVRELRRTARALDTDERLAALLVETAAAAGLLGATQGIDPVLLPTPDFDTWRRRSPAEQWVALATAWLAMARQPGLVGRRDERDRVITALGPDAERGTIAVTRRLALGVLASVPPGAVPDGRAGVLDRLSWLAPRRAGAQRPTVEEVLDEAEHLGVTAAGGLTGYGRALLDDAPTAAEDALRRALPEPVDYFLVQPDLTMVVPGTPDADLADDLALTADLESSGGANVYRVTETSVRRALDAGRTGADIAALFAERSTTPVPQALRYLIDDVARRHGVLRTGLAASYLRCDDEALLSRVVADSDLSGLGLRRIAPTVVVSTVAVGRVLDMLRESGYAPAAESPDGAVLVTGADLPRAPSRPRRVNRSRAAGDAPQRVAELVRRMRSGDRLTALSRRVQPTGQRLPGVTTAATLGLLRDAIRGARPIWLGYVDTHGTTSQHTITPISMAGGTLRGHDQLTGRLTSFALHHITAVALADQADAADNA